MGSWSCQYLKEYVDELMALRACRISTNALWDRTDVAILWGSALRRLQMHAPWLPLGAAIAKAAVTLVINVDELNADRQVLRYNISW